MTLAARLARIGQRDAAVRGWASLAPSPETAISGPLAGLACGVKDVIDVAGLPTTHGSTLCTEVATVDATAVARVRAAGAAIIGKTVTAEFATYHPGPTVNPRRPGHTPGGSSSGSAAVVADGQADFAFGTQTAGSIIRPASYCGVLGFKPSFARYLLEGVLVTAPRLDTLGMFARTLDILDRVDAVVADDVDIGETRAPRVGLCRSPAWPLADSAMRAAFESVARELAERDFETVEIELPERFGTLGAAQRSIHAYEIARALGSIAHAHPKGVSVAFAAMIAEGEAITTAAYRNACDVQDACRGSLDAVFADVDVLLVPGATGAAPEGLASTGDPAFQRIWTAVGTPCLGFPARWTPEGLPLGMQLIARPGQDRALLSFARALLTIAQFREPDDR